jgi:hypothetical protein
MPRPKRSKVALSAAAPRVAQSTTSIVEHPSEPALPVESKDMYNVSDPDEAIVTSARRVKRNNGKGKAVAARGQTKATRTNSRDVAREDSLSEAGESRRTETHALAEESLGEGLDDIDLGSSSPAMEVGRRERGTPTVEDSLLAIGNFRRRPRQPSILGRAGVKSGPRHGLDQYWQKKQLCPATSTTAT